MGTAILETDAAGNPIGNGKRSDFLYDATRRLTAISTPNGEQVNFLFDAGGRLQETHLPNGISARYRYDAGNKLTQLVNRTSQGIISQHVYGYDGLGRRKTHTETIANTTTNHGYAYDNLDRLTKVLNGTTPVETSTYDQYNNRRTRTANGATHYYQHDTAQQLNKILTGSDTGSEAARFQYDDNGNLVYKNQNGVTRTYTYDALERLTQVQGSNIATESYRYDPQGRRIEKSASGTTTRYHYSDQSLWAEYQSWNQALAHYTYSGLDRPVLRSTANPADTRYYHHDGLGSVVATSNAAGATQASTRFDAWGNILSQTGNTPHFGYTGQVPDATGLIHYRARYYDPALGRFTQPDPAGFVDGINRYAYVGNSPVNFTDPLGLGRQAVVATSGLGSTYTANNSNSLGDMTSIAGTALTAADVANTAGSCQAGACLGRWQGANGQWYNAGWGGNQWTGGRGIAQAATQSFRVVGSGLTVASVGVELIEMGAAVNNQNAIEIADSAIDLTMIVPTVLGGPVGFVLGVGYTVVDNTIGFDTFSGPLTDLLCSSTGNC